MGTSYKIKCKHCGTHFDHYVHANYGMMPTCVGCGDYIETEMAIRCPSCHKKLNNTVDEFNDQIEVTYIWD